MQELSVTIDFLPENIGRYRSGYAIVAIDVIRATTTLATGKALGRRCYVAPDVEQALSRASSLERPLLAGEKAGDMPAGFEMTNSPAALALRVDIERPMILVSSSGTRLIDGAQSCEAAYLACFRNWRAIAARVCGYPRVAVIGAGTRGEFREEDQICCAWVARYLIERGYMAGDARTLDIVARWGSAPPEACRVSRSVAYLKRSNQLHDLEFILSHVDDLELVLMLSGDEVVTADASEVGQITSVAAAPARRRSELRRYGRRAAVLPR